MSPIPLCVVAVLACVLTTFFTTEASPIFSDAGELPTPFRYTFRVERVEFGQSQSDQDEYPYPPEYDIDSGYDYPHEDDEDCYNIVFIDYGENDADEEEGDEYITDEEDSNEEYEDEYSTDEEYSTEEPEDPSSEEEEEVEDIEDQQEEEVSTEEVEVPENEYDTTEGYSENDEDNEVYYDDYDYSYEDYENEIPDQEEGSISPRSVKKRPGLGHRMNHGPKHHLTHNRFPLPTWMPKAEAGHQPHQHPHIRIPNHAASKDNQIPFPTWMPKLGDKAETGRHPPVRKPHQHPLVHIHHAAVKEKQNMRKN